MRQRGTRRRRLATVEIMKIMVPFADKVAERFGAGAEWGRLAITRLHGTSPAPNA
jgi:hypothetical protein